MRGSGILETAQTEPIKLEAGNVFVLFPGIWHRYRPDLQVGWTESWIEFQGGAIQRLVDEGLFEPSRPVFKKADVSEVTGLFQEAGRLARAKPGGYQVRIGLLALQVLTLLHAGRGESVPRAIDRVVEAAEGMMKGSVGAALSPAEIAERLGVGYSYFRRSFRASTGFSPKQYQAELRLRRARELLQSSDLSLKAIADRLGYDSAFHFSEDFYKRCGVRPSRWRKGE